MSSLTNVFAITLLARLFVLSSAMKKNCQAGTFFDGGTCKQCAPGTYQNEKGATSCKLCPPGTYNPYLGAQGLDVCIPCKEGTFSVATGAAKKSTCKKCPKGTNAPAGATECISCPPGKYMAFCDPFRDDYSFFELGQCFYCFSCAGCSGARAQDCSPEPPKLKCYDCSGSVFSDKPNSLECSSCPEGTGVKKGSTKCERCPPGTEPSFDSGCTPCTGFTFSNSEMKYCGSCPAGFTANSRKGGTKCVPCPVGTFKRADNNACRPCKPGENSFVKGATFCMPDNTPCAPNFFRSAHGACLQCTERQRYDEKKKACVQCPKDHFSAGGLTKTCQRCPPNSKNSESDYEAPCVCKQGWTQDLQASEVKCKKCPPGTAGDSSSFCNICQPNTFAPKAGMKECLSCPPGTRQLLQRQTKCVRFSCPKGTVKQDTQCIVPATNCPKDHDRLEDQYGLITSNPRKCPSELFLAKPCTNSTQARGAKNVIRVNAMVLVRRNDIRCRNNEISAGGLQQKCKAYKPGERPLSLECGCYGGRRIKNGRCVKCPKGTVARSSNDVECIPCIGGSSGEFPFGCTTCPAGKFSDKTGSTSRNQCPKGTTAFGPGESACVKVGSLAPSG